MNNQVEVIKKASIEKKAEKKSVLKVAAYCRVSTDSEEQINSYESQKNFYTKMITEHEGWELVGIYADEAITGTSVDKRESFLKMVTDALDHKIDLIICKSISRFARNTVDTLQYVRMLKNHNVGVYFEEENIRTLSMDGELLLTILSSVAQQEVQNISEHVKSGVRHRMLDGELFGYNGNLGYDYHKDTKTITVNEEEAKIVRYIYERYLSGAGAATIAKELSAKGYVTKKGSKTWAQSTVLGIIRNEKYVGDLMQQKTYTVDPITKHRAKNNGYADKYYIRDHHEAIIPRAEWEAAQEILKKRGYSRQEEYLGKKRTKFSREYAFSSKIECGFCGHNLTRRSWHANSQYQRAVWFCSIAGKRGKKFCPHSRGVPEEMIEKAFVEIFHQISKNQEDIVDEFTKNTEAALSDDTLQKEIKSLGKEIDNIKKNISSLIDLLLNQKIPKDVYEKKYDALNKELTWKQKEYELKKDKDRLREDTYNRIEEFKKSIIEHQNLKEFDPEVFEMLIDKVIAGGYDENGNPDPFKLTFVFKTFPLENETIDGNKFRTDKRKKVLPPNNSDIPETLSPNSSNEGPAEHNQTATMLAYGLKPYLV